MIQIEALAKDGKIHPQFITVELVCFKESGENCGKNRISSIYKLS